MTLALRDQRLRLYALTEHGADGWTRPRYDAVADVWGRLEPPSGADLSRFEGDEHTIAAVVTMHWSAVVPKGGMVRVLPGGDGLSDYRITAVVARRMTGEQLVYVSSMAEDEKPHEVSDAAIPVTAFTLDPSGPQYVPAGSDVQITCTPLDANGYPLARTVAYSSTTGNVTVDEAGLVHAVSVGFALVQMNTGAAGTSVAFHVTA